MRQDIDYSHPAFRFLAERLIRKIVERYREHPAVLGWQVDNEPGLKLFYNHSVFEGFIDYLRDRYGDVDTLNKRWGLTYWSHRLSDWSDLWIPDGNSTPSYDLAWRRYQAQLTHKFIAWEAEIVRELVPEHQYVTTCVALGQVGLDITRVGEPLDVVGTNVYYATQDGLELPGADEPGARCTRSSWPGAVRRGCTCRPTCPGEPGSNRSWSPRPTRRRSAGRPTTSRPTRASSGRWYGAWSPAVPD